jgi:hypothetical protein
MLTLEPTALALLAIPSTLNDIVRRAADESVSFGSYGDDKMD